ncbi:MAG: GNAT family N-acetyltransferase [Oscillospiraceae bacterium]
MPVRRTRRFSASGWFARFTGRFFKGTGGLRMQYLIKKLKPEMAGEYVDFFENHGFDENDCNRGCYCVWHHWTAEHENARSLLPQNERPFVKRDYAIALIKSGKLNGFAAFLDGKMAGFCNADYKENYWRLDKRHNPDSWLGLSGKVLSIVCFVVDVNLRGKGIASALLAHVCDYASDMGIDYVEAYPSVGEFKQSACCGPLHMYEKQGFSVVCNRESEAVVRKATRQGG